MDDEFHTTGEGICMTKRLEFSRECYQAIQEVLDKAGVKFFAQPEEPYQDIVVMGDDKKLGEIRKMLADSNLDKSCRIVQETLKERDAKAVFTAAPRVKVKLVTILPPIA
jgi:hypothetical protein